MTYEQWEAGAPAELRSDPLWTLRVYRTALYTGELARRDAQVIGERPEFLTLSEQLRRAAESISANIAEGYSRLSLRDRARYYEYAIGSAREARDWYFKAREALDHPTTAARLAALTSIIRIMTALVANHRPAKSSAD